MRRTFVLLAALGAACTAARAASGTNDPPVTAKVETVMAERQIVKDRIKVFGTITPPEQATSDISFLHGGQVVKIDVQPGQRVQAGADLVELATDPAAALSYRNAKAAVGFAQRDLDRSKQLLAQHLATNAQVAAAQKTLTDAQAALQNEIALGNDKGSETVKAPADGYVASVLAAVGDRMAANTPVLKLTRTDLPGRATIGLEPDIARRVGPGMIAMVSPTYGSGQAPALRGQVQAVSAALDPATHLINAWVTLPANVPPRPAGVSVEVTVIAAQHEGLTVPRQAVQRDGKGAYLFTVADGKAHRVDVRTGIETDKITELLDDPGPGLPVVAVGNFELKDGMAVDATPMPMP